MSVLLKAAHSAHILLRPFSKGALEDRSRSGTRKYRLGGGVPEIKLDDSKLRSLPELGSRGVSLSAGTLPQFGGVVVRSFVDEIDFKREAEIAVQVARSCLDSSDYFVLPFAQSTSGNTFRLVYPDLLGRDLQSSISQIKQLSPRTIVRIICDIARALHRLHSKAGLVHGDLRLTRCIPVADVAHLDPASAKPLVKLSGLNHSVAIGTVQQRLPPPSFVAPELQSDRPVKYDEAVDVYAFGVICFQLLTGRLASDFALSSWERITRSPTHPGPPRDKPGPDLDAFTKFLETGEQELKDVVFECWLDNPRARPSFEEIIRLLEPLQSRMFVVVQCGFSHYVQDSNISLTPSYRCLCNRCCHFPKQNLLLGYFLKSTPTRCFTLAKRVQRVWKTRQLSCPGS